MGLYEKFLNKLGTSTAAGMAEREAVAGLAMARNTAAKSTILDSEAFSRAERFSPGRNLAGKSGSSILDSESFSSGMANSKMSFRDRIKSFGATSKTLGRNISDSVQSSSVSAYKSSMNAFNKVSGYASELKGMTGEQRVESLTKSATNGWYNAKEGMQAGMAHLKGAWGALGEEGMNNIGSRFTKDITRGAVIGAGSSIVGTGLGMMDGDIDGHGFVRNAAYGATVGALTGAAHAGGMVAAKYRGVGANTANRIGESLTTGWGGTGIRTAAIAATIAGGIDIRTRAHNKSY